MSFQTGLSGLNASSRNLDVIGNNIANANTTGMKSSRAEFADVVASSLGSAGGTQAGIGVGIASIAQQFTQGNITITGNSLDVAINGEGYLAVQGADGKEAYTRAGDLRITPQGFLQTGAGLNVLGQDGPITVQPAEKVTIGSDGTISIIPLGSGNATTQVEVGRIKLVQAASENLEKSNDGLLRTKDGQPVAANADVRLAQGVLEGSNVNAISAMVDMIELARNFELQTKVMKSVDENSAVGAKLIQM